jgi:hypothetical protein
VKNKRLSLRTQRLSENKIIILSQRRRERRGLFGLNNTRFGILCVPGALARVKIM